MRVLFSLAAVLAVLALVAVLAKKQLTQVALPAPPAAPTPASVAPQGTPSQQLEQFRRGLDQALQQPARKVDE